MTHTPADRGHDATLHDEPREATAKGSGSAAFVTGVVIADTPSTRRGGAPWDRETLPEGSPMARESLVAVSYPVDDEFSAHQYRRA